MIVAAAVLATPDIWGQRFFLQLRQREREQGHIRKIFRKNLAELKVSRNSWTTEADSFPQSTKKWSQPYGNVWSGVDFATTMSDQPAFT